MYLINMQNILMTRNLNPLSFVRAEIFNDRGSSHRSSCSTPLCSRR